MKTISVPHELLLNELPVHPSKAVYRQARRLTKWNNRMNEIKREAIYKARSSRAFAKLNQDAISVLLSHDGLDSPPFPVELGRFLVHRGICDDPNVLHSDLRAFVTLYKSWLCEVLLPLANDESLMRLAHLLVLIHKDRSNDVAEAVSIALANETMTRFLGGEANVRPFLEVLACKGLRNGPDVLAFMSRVERRRLTAMYSHLPECPLTPYRPFSSFTMQKRIMAPSATADKLRRQAGVWEVDDLREVLGEGSLRSFPRARADRINGVRTCDMDEFAYCVKDKRAYNMVKGAMMAGRNLTPREKAIVLESMYLL
ncbi:hypothetical protein LTR78_000608 [Recurvomyces mirabilis]|uniref:Uncharacterized protein n=1 Tax=Recurvomyces mirabilis TaxID=574656 RepID=A0AAE0WYK6_9PEZI|nr:hypothetical protein LTR78_000608 [Recurvomyces mirabilis]KAK5162262.1 hypothetical protein LTS14_000609 [Recurvomyces mirabilis]